MVSRQDKFIDWTLLSGARHVFFTKMSDSEGEGVFQLDHGDLKVDTKPTSEHIQTAESSPSHRDSLTPIMAELGLREILTSSDQVLTIHDYAAEDVMQEHAKSPTLRKKVDLDSFRLLRVIGRGAYGKVFLVEQKDGSHLYAMKVLKKATIVVHGKEHEHTMNERSILQAVRHPFIVKLYYAFQTKAKLYLLLSYASGGELFSYLAQERMFSDDVACFYISELLLAIEHLHTLGIIYRYLVLMQ